MKTMSNTVTRVDYLCGCAVESWPFYGCVTAIRVCPCHLPLEDAAMSLDDLADEIAREATA